MKYQREILDDVSQFGLIRQIDDDGVETQLPA